LVFSSSYSNPFGIVASTIVFFFLVEPLDPFNEKRDLTFSMLRWNIGDVIDTTGVVESFGLLLLVTFGVDSSNDFLSCQGLLEEFQTFDALEFIIAGDRLLSVVGP